MPNMWKKTSKLGKDVLIENLKISVQGNGA
jgi:hypothetical protein